MREYLELRVNHAEADRVFRPDEGKWLGYNCRKVLIETCDPRMPEIGRIRRELEAVGSSFFSGCYYVRKYTKDEVERAELFWVFITACFEPAGEECGTVYDETTACRFCGAGRTQRSDLILDLRRAPKSKQIARTVADEWIVSQELAELLEMEPLTGFRLSLVQHRSRHQEEPVDPTRFAAGRQLLAMAEERGFAYGSARFHGFINAPEQEALVHEMHREAVEKKLARDAVRPYKAPSWYQLTVTSRPVHMTPETRFGIHPFDLDEVGKYRCPLGHTGGLNLLSEVFVRRDQYDGSDIAMTEDLCGWRQGLLVPSPLLLISPRMREVLLQNNIRGWRWEVAYLR